jgi:hypothetical protein
MVIPGISIDLDTKYSKQLKKGYRKVLFHAFIDGTRLFDHRLHRDRVGVVPSHAGHANYTNK